MARATSSLPVPASRCSHLSTSQSRVRQTRKMNCTDSAESHAALTELTAKYHAIQALEIAEVHAFGKQCEATEAERPKLTGCLFECFFGLIGHGALFAL